MCHLILHIYTQFCNSYHRPTISVRPIALLALDTRRKSLQEIPDIFRFMVHHIIRCFYRMTPTHPLTSPVGDGYGMRLWNLLLNTVCRLYKSELSLAVRGDTLQQVTCTSVSSAICSAVIGTNI